MLCLFPSIQLSRWGQSRARSFTHTLGGPKYKGTWQIAGRWAWTRPRSSPDSWWIGIRLAATSLQGLCKVGSACRIFSWGTIGANLNLWCSVRHSTHSCYNKLARSLRRYFHLRPRRSLPRARCHGSIRRSLGRESSQQGCWSRYRNSKTRL